MVKVVKYGIIHFHAVCQNCDWSAAIEFWAINRNQRVRNKVYSHVNKTGHTVTIESGSSTDYVFKKMKK